MAQLFDDVFKPQGIHEMLFFNVKSVLKYPTTDQLEEEDKLLAERWRDLAKVKYNANIVGKEFYQQIYEQNAVKFPEFSKIVAITYATMYTENGKVKRYMKKIVNDDEYIVLSTFMEELYQLSSEATKSTPHYFPILCGHNIISKDIPHLVKKIILYKDKFEKGIPLILKRSLGIKPWESGIIDTLNVWKFNGFDNMSLMLISDFMGLKRTVDLLSADEVSKQYWGMMTDDSEKALEFISLQSATQTNIVIQLMFGLRHL